MARILYMSDLHLEMERWRLSLPGWQDFLRRRRTSRLHPLRGPLLMDAGKVDLIVLAGDIHTGLRGFVYAGQLAAYFAAKQVAPEPEKKPEEVEGEGKGENGQNAP